MTNNLFSLLNYIGHKSKILDDIFSIAPKNVDGVFWDIFCGSSVVGLSCPYEKVVCVDTNQHLIDLYSNLCNPLFPSHDLFGSFKYSLLGLIEELVRE